MLAAGNVEGCYVKQSSAPSDTTGSTSQSQRLAHPLGGLVARYRREKSDGSGLAFGIRMLATVALTFTLIGSTGYLLLERNLAHRQIENFAAAQQADAKGFEDLAVRAGSSTSAIIEIDHQLDGIEQRPDTLEARLIDGQHIIVAAGKSALLGTHDVDRPTSAALAHGRSYAGRESDPKADKRDFEFVVPISLLGKRYAYVTVYEHRSYDAQLQEVRTLLALLGLLALIGGGAVFYLVGGRRLMRDHQMSLLRATRDGLTDLANHRAFQDEFTQAVASAARYEDPMALVLLDVDDFKLVNDRHGHPHGDAMLKRVAEALRGTRPGDRSYRIGGDEFALLLAHTDIEGARTMVRRLSRVLADASVQVSMGVSVLRPGLSAETLRAEADVALYEAKRQGGHRAAHFEDIREQVVVTTSEKKDAGRRLIEEGRLTTVFQPIWNLDAEELLGVEALSRPDPSYGLSGPAEAFDVAEQLGRVHQLDVLCVQSALKSAPELGPGVLLFLNLSPFTLDLDAEGEDWLQVAVKDAGLAPQQIVVEVTERFGGRTSSVVKSLLRLRRQGFRIAVDDVGTGNSGLEMLRQLDAEFVKLDRSIVTAAATEPGARAVLMAMATFARQTGAFVIAEGIEDGETLEFLRNIDDSALFSGTIIQGGQGFGLGRPSTNMTPPHPDYLHSAAYVS